MCSSYISCITYLHATLQNNKYTRPTMAVLHALGTQHVEHNDVDMHHKGLPTSVLF